MSQDSSHALCFYLSHLVELSHIQFPSFEKSLLFRIRLACIGQGRLFELIEVHFPLTKKPYNLQRVVDLTVASEFVFDVVVTERSHLVAQNGAVDS